MADARTITQAEFSRQCGVSTTAIYTAAKEGRVAVRRNGRVDPGHPKNIEYLAGLRARGFGPDKPKGREGKSAVAGTGRPRVQGTQEETKVWTKTDADIAKAQAQTAKIHMEIAQRMGTLLLAEEVQRCFGDIYSAFANHVLVFGQRVAPIICSHLGVSDSEDLLKIQKILDDEHERILEDVRRATVDALKERRYRQEDESNSDDE
jgi:hypothetical protein